MLRAQRHRPRAPRVKVLGPNECLELVSEGRTSITAATPGSTRRPGSDKVRLMSAVFAGCSMMPCMHARPPGDGMWLGWLTPPNWGQTKNLRCGGSKPPVAWGGPLVCLAASRTSLRGSYTVAHGSTVRPAQNSKESGCPLAWPGVKTGQEGWPELSCSCRHVSA